MKKIRKNYLWTIFLICFIISACDRKDFQFEKIESKVSGITFNNLIIESDSINQLDIENVYNGGGVGIGDFNNDGLPDIYFTGNIVPCKMYLNDGEFKFRDITDKAGVTGEGRWCRGIAVVDINNDGWQDLYISATLKKKASERQNLLYINKGLDKDKIPVFEEKAVEYGLADDSHTSQSYFFDYDNDGDLDVYMVVNEISKSISPYQFRPVLKNGDNPSTGKLFRNDWSDSLNHPVFTDVSKEAGIQVEGYGHSAIITDINNDGWMDIFIGNDFLTSDLLWINNGNGTFTNQLNQYFKHTAANSMGNDIGDINNDMLPDIVSLDMNPEDNYRKKMMLMPASYQTYQNTERYGYNYQYVRNTLQLNQGKTVGQNDSLGHPIFSEIGYFSGISATDWSWTPLIADFNNDGYRDIFISNGFPKDITDHDFAVFRAKAYLATSKDQLLIQVPEVKIHNYIFKNNGNLTFSNMSEEWGLNLPTFSNGAACADLDLDGDLDLVINNINDEALVYKNKSIEKKEKNSNFIRIKLKGEPKNPEGIGSWIEIYYGHSQNQVYEMSLYKGYISTFEAVAHFGLGKETLIDSIIVKWPNGKIHQVKNIAANQLITIDYKKSVPGPKNIMKLFAVNPIFTEITSSLGANFIHQETDFVDFNIQKLLPHKFSEYGPAIASGDMDGNTLDDIVLGGSSNNSATILYQQKNGKFQQKKLLNEKQLKDKNFDDTGILLFDADGDNDLDIYSAAGGFESEANSSVYKDHFYENDGKGNFIEKADAIPSIFTSKFCVRAADIDKDGDLDLFIAGRVAPWLYPMPVSSYLLRNDSKPGKIKFTDITKEFATDLIDIGLVCDAVFTDFNNDGWTDLILAGEWMPVTFLQNIKGKFKNFTENTGLKGHTGWWNSITAGDFDNDLDIDYIVGNLGQNSFFKASPEYPVSVYASDFDNNGSYDAFPTLYLPISLTDTTKKEYPAHTRDDAIKQMLKIRTLFTNYKSYANSTIQDIFSAEILKKALIVRANYLNSVFIRNEGNGHFSIKSLPAQAQLSALNGMLTDDFDSDGNLDVLINTNDWSTEVLVGRYDALNGLLLKGDGKGGFTPKSIVESGIFISGNGRGIAKLIGSENKYLVAASQNRGALKIYKLNVENELIKLRPNDLYVEIEYFSGIKRKEEIYYGNSFLSQSSRFIKKDSKMKSITIYNNLGEKRSVITKTK
jgi:hypothetical protein